MSSYDSGQPAKSKIRRSIFSKRLSSLYGFNAVDKNNAKTDFEKQYGIRLVKVDVDNDAYKFKQASLGTVFQSYQFNSSLQKYFDAYLQETILSYSDIGERQDRLNELKFMRDNEPFIARCVDLYAFESTQVDDQSRLISVESPSAPFISKCYELFAQWGITQQRTQSTCRHIELYGEAVWAHRVTERGIEKVIPVKVNDLIERLEFSASRMAEYLAQLRGNADFNRNRKSKVERLLNLIQGKDAEGREKIKDGAETTLDDTDENFADLFDSKLLGYEFHDNNIVPPWCVTHFRYENAEDSEFFPYPRPPLLHCIAPFKQVMSTTILQGLARSMSFPVTLYKVKNTEGMPPATAFEQTDRIRAEYENVGVTPGSNSLEVYTLNTKIWVPDGILDIEVKESKVDIDFVGDLELFMDRVAIAAGVPKSYLDQEFGGFGNSGIALVEQYKPFARQVYTIQSCYLDGLSDLIRLHFAITGEFDYNTPFVLTMRFPAEDMGEEKRDARQASLDLATSVVELVSQALGLEEGEPLPDDIIFDILSQYTFLDETDVLKWMRHRQQLDAERAQRDLSGEDEDGEEGSDDLGDIGDLGDDEGGMDDLGDVGDEVMEASKEERLYYLRTRALLAEKRQAKKARIREVAKKAARVKAKETRRLREERFKKLREHYKEVKKDLYFSWLKENSMREWRDVRGHQYYPGPVTVAHPLYETFQALQGGQATTNRLKEAAKTLSEVLDDMAAGYPTDDPLSEAMNAYSSPNDELTVEEMNRSPMAEESKVA